MFFFYARAWLPTASIQHVRNKKMILESPHSFLPTSKVEQIFDFNLSFVWAKK
jgi:hypothetical protein